MAVRKPDARTLAGFFTVVVLLGANFVAVRFSNQELAPFWGATLRFAAATAILIGIMLIRRLRFPNPRIFFTAFLYGLFGFGLSYGLLYWALLSVPSGFTAVIFSTLPLITLVFAAMSGLERFGRRNVIGAIIAVAGISYIFSDQLRVTGSMWALGAIGLAVVVSAASSVLVKRLEKPHPVTLNAIGMGAGTVFLLLCSLVAKEPVRFPEQPSTWIALVWLTGSAVIAFVLFVWIISRWTASAATYALVLAPLVTILTAVWLVHEPITWTLVIGGLIALFGAYLGASQPADRTMTAAKGKP